MNLSETCCFHCKNSYREYELVETDYFGSCDPIFSCKKCFIMELTTRAEGLNLFCDNCDEKLLPNIDVDFEDRIIWFNCPNSKDTNEDDHTQVGEYIIQPVG